MLRPAPFPAPHDDRDQTRLDHQNHLRPGSIPPLAPLLCHWDLLRRVPETEHLPRVDVNPYLRSCCGQELDPKPTVSWGKPYQLGLDEIKGRLGE